MNSEQLTNDESEPEDSPAFAHLVERLDSLWFEERREAAAELPNLVGRRCGGYTIRNVIGRGSFGVVYRASDDQLQRYVALKSPRPEVLLDPERFQRFHSEAATAARLDHPAIVPGYEANLSGPTPYIVSALCTGPDLCRWLADREVPATAEDAARLVADLAGAVHYAHGKGILHRDLKPSNILLEPLASYNDGKQLAEFQPKLTDFGLAKIAEAGLQDTRSSLLVGTPLYMAPEQLSSDAKRVSAATDVYALGAVLYELLTLRPPFEGSSYVEVLDKLHSGSPRPLRAERPEVSVDLETICAKCLEKDPANRYATAAELAEDLSRFLAGKPIHAHPVNWRDRFSRWVRQPERIRNAGVTTVWFQALSSVWMWLIAGASIAISSIEIDGVRTAIDSLIATLSFNTPLFVLGWLVMRGNRWAFVPAALLSCAELVVAVHAATDQGLLFAHAYPTLTSKLASYTMLIMGSALQFIMYALAVPAWLRERRAGVVTAISPSIGK
ncbi:serine/threonine-protein kinase [Aeoliella mucimassa]|uniref:non-specific serine/threonine protein kinase n=1 Tax=Aeoliella mucimassa TaxID=2527972 RepID=A0A518AJC8_9BACT|nr:serine/threonine-protein kinase [Aeoliella mucimassa]QDU54825.1 Serine/threonine-protein kinase PknB [Aeoliella mucimassa]